MIGGLFGYLGYDMVRQMEHLPARTDDALGLPDAILLRPTLFVIFDNVRDELIIAAAVRPQQGGDAKEAYEAGRALLASARATLAIPSLVSPPPFVQAPQPEPESNMTRAQFLDMVERAKDYIAAGDVFQVVCSQRFSAPFVLPPLELYRALRRINPAPFLFFFDFGTFAVAGSSPEVLVRLRDGVVTIRPLAGTRPRGVDHEEDQRLEAELLTDPKERAEHLMLLDLGRNDVSRVTVPGTVCVTQSFAIERFSHVMHISSNVQGSLRDDLGAVDALMAGFPAGTLSGAPKIRAMEIIDELEPTRRGVYGGCVGYFAANGSMDTCIALRTAVLKDGVMYVQAGGGIVADSVPETEFEETCHKARALFRAAQEAIRAAAAR
jgi:anthranilate synthase component 1